MHTVACLALIAACLLGAAEARTVYVISEGKDVVGQLEVDRYDSGDCLELVTSCGLQQVLLVSLPNATLLTEVHDFPCSFAVASTAINSTEVTCARNAYTKGVEDRNKDFDQFLKNIGIWFLWLCAFLVACAVGLAEQARAAQLDEKQPQDLQLAAAV